MSDFEIVTIGRPLAPDPDQLIKLISEAVSDQWLSNSGALHSRLERELSSWFGDVTTRLVSSGTMALMVALRAGNLPEGSEIITTPLSFAATTQAIL